MGGTATHLSSSERRRLLADAHRDFVEAASRYWDVHQVSITLGTLPVADLEEEGVTLRTQPFQLLVTPPHLAGRNQWWAFLVENGTVVWKASVNNHFAAIEVAIVATARVLKQPDVDLAATFAAARTSVGVATHGKRRRFSFMRRLGLTLREYALALEAPPERVVLWHQRLGLPIPSHLSRSETPRLIDRIRVLAEGGGLAVQMARSLGMDSVGVARAIRYVGLIDAAKARGHPTTQNPRPS